MPHDNVSKYLKEVESLLKSFKDCHFEKYEEEILTPNRINLRIRIRFLKGYLLEISETIIYEKGKLKHLSYRYHFQDKNDNLIFRFDNAPHYPGLNNFPHHKHDSTGVSSIEKPKMIEVIRNVQKYIIDK